MMFEKWWGCAYGIDFSFCFYEGSSDSACGKRRRGGEEGLHVI
jgi:hypothetical protein